MVAVQSITELYQAMEAVLNPPGPARVAPGKAATIGNAAGIILPCC